MLPTPSTYHIPPNTYPPAEDSFLFLDALSSGFEKGFLASRFSHPSASPLAVEIGTGSGIILAFITANAEAILGRSDILTLGTDVNASACSAAQNTVQSYCCETVERGVRRTGRLLGCCRCDLTSAVLPGTVDLLVFNPPYVPSEEVPSSDVDLSLSDFQRESRYLALATDGGFDGLEVTERTLSKLPEILSERGVAYILFCQRNQPDRVIERIRMWAGPRKWVADKVNESGRTGGFEKLCIVRISRVQRESGESGR